MKLERGLFTDCAEVDQPVSTYRFAKNLVDGNTMNSKENERGFTDFGIIAPYDIIGIVPTEDSFVVFSTDNTDSEIGHWVGGVYSTVYNDPDLNFSTSAPIKGEYRRDVNGDLIVAWIDDVNKPKIINITNPSISDIEDTNLFQNVMVPTISGYSITDNGGSLLTGAYIILTKYKDETGAETSWFVQDKTFYINNESKAVTFDQNDGAEAGEVSSKSINLTLSDCDTAFDTIIIGYLQVQAGVITPYQVMSKSNSSTVNVTITGSETATKLSLEEVLTTQASYNNAKAITQVNGQLALANLTSDSLPELQTAALGIEINYNYSLVDVISNNSSHKDVLPPSLMPGEVYAFYLGVELKNGNKVFYHIPGRPAVATETDTITTDGITHKRYQISDTNNAGGAATNMGFWENENEQYPNEAIYNGTSLGNPDLRTLNVRHHRTPSLGWLVANVYSGDATVGITRLPRIGIDVSNVVIPAPIQDQINNWRIYFAKKSGTNSIVLGSDLLQYNVAADNDTNTFWSTGGNWTIDAEKAGGGVWGNIDSVKTASLRGHSLDLLQEIGQTTPLFAWMNYKLRRTGVNNQYTGFRSTGGRLSVSGSGRGQTSSAVIDFTVPAVTVRSGSSTVRKLNDFQYLPQNALVGKFKSKDTEGCFVAEFSSYTPGITISELNTKSSGASPEDAQFTILDGEDTVFMQYGRLLTDAHNSFLSQELVPMEGVAIPSVTSLPGVQGGDAFLCYMSYITTAPLGGSDVPENPLQGVRMWKGYIGYSRRNWNYRHQIQGNLSTYYHGKADVRTLFSPNLLGNTLIETATLVNTAESLNVLEYNEDYSYLNSNVVGVIYSADLVDATEFPTTVIYTPPQNEESENISWRTFPANNRYVMPKNKGEIINLQGVGNRDILIHHRYSLFKTRTDLGMRGESDNIYLKSNELFAVQPQELVSANTGYAGTQNKFGCLLTKAGYSFVDDIQGKVFLYSGESLNEISTDGMRKFFRDNMGIASDNPFTSNGYSIAYDETFNRILISKKEIHFAFGDISWTASYSPTKKCWVSFHDYTPDYMFNLVNNTLYSVRDNKLYRHNTGDYGVFYDGVIYPMVIDVVQNPEPNIDKVFTGSGWVTESYTPAGVLQYNDTFNYITLRSLEHCTDRTLLTKITDLGQLYEANIRNLNRTWYFNAIRDVSIQPGFTLGFYENYELDPTKLNTNTSWFDQRRFVDKFVICRLEYNNDLNNRFLLTECSVEYRYAR